MEVTADDSKLDPVSGFLRPRRRRNGAENTENSCCFLYRDITKYLLVTVSVQLFILRCTKRLCITHHIVYTDTHSTRFCSYILSLTVRSPPFSTKIINMFVYFLFSLELFNCIIHFSVYNSVWCGRTWRACTDTWPQSHPTPLGWTEPDTSVSDVT